uniref:Putative secreted protein n=1 Tax=Ixodes ricinus TaxID=34613 RepID=A0A147BCP4_IXORI
MAPPIAMTLLLMVHFDCAPFCTTFLPRCNIPPRKKFVQSGQNPFMPLQCTTLYSLAYTSTSLGKDSHPCFLTSCTWPIVAIYTRCLANGEIMLGVMLHGHCIFWCKHFPVLIICPAAFKNIDDRHSA